MIQITPHMRSLVAVEPVDFRAGVDGLVAVCRKRLQADPFSGALFDFGNRARTGIKIVVYDGQGFWLCHKRLSSGRFAWWPDGAQPGRTLQACELAGPAHGRGPIAGAGGAGLAPVAHGGLALATQRGAGTALETMSH